MELTIKGALTDEQKEISSQVRSLTVNIPITTEIFELFQNIISLKANDVFPSDVVFPKLETLRVKTNNNTEEILKNHKGSLRNLELDVLEGVLIPDDLNLTHLEISGDLSKIIWNNRKALLSLTLSKSTITDHFLETLSKSAPSLNTLSIKNSKLEVTDTKSDVEWFKSITTLNYVDSVLRTHEPLLSFLKLFKNVESLDLSNISNGGSWKCRDAKEKKSKPSFTFEKIQDLNLLYCDHGFEIVHSFSFPNLLNLNFEYTEDMPSNLEKLSIYSTKIESLKVTSFDLKKAEFISLRFQNIQFFEARSRFIRPEVIELLDKNLEYLKKAEIRYHFFESERQLKPLKEQFPDWEIVLEDGEPCLDPDDMIGSCNAEKRVIMKKDGKLFRLGGFIKKYDFL